MDASAVPPARDVSPGAPVFFLHFPEEAVALEAAAALLHKGYRVEITPPRPDVGQWDVYPAGVPEGVSAEDAGELMQEWSWALGGSYSGAELPAEPEDGDEGYDDPGVGG